jgi:hypothetical protein
MRLIVVKLEGERRVILEIERERERERENL